MSDNELMSEKDAAEMLGISPRTLQKWRHAKHVGAPPYYKLPTGLVRYKRSDLERYVSSSLVVTE